MWAKLIRWLAPMAVKAVADRMIGRKGELVRLPRAPWALTEAPSNHDPRITALQNQIDRVSDAQGRQAADVAMQLRLLTGRLQVAVWLSITSAVVTLVLLIVVLLR